ncbi:MAG: efflux RND transporter permease subunit [Elusimicrobia bacterium]|nr:efflux RND transporter permease subunit [Elusimicrobiota bacterium]
MDLPELSVKQPVFVTSIVILMLAAGGLLMTRLGVDLYPDVAFPTITATVEYPGAGPDEVETQILKPLEDEVAAIAGLKKLRATAKEGVGTIVAEFTLETDPKYAEQQVRVRVDLARRKLPDDAKEPVIRRFDPSDTAQLAIAVSADLSPAELYDLADDVVRPALQQVPQVGLVEVVGGRKREIRVDLDRAELARRELSAGAVSDALAAAGKNTPAGRVTRGAGDRLFRTIGDFADARDVESVIVAFRGNETPIRVRDLGKVGDGLQDEKTRAFWNGKPALYVQVYRQSGSNTLAVVDAVKARLAKLQAELAARPGAPTLTVVMDRSKAIKDNVDDVKETIFLGIILTFVVVFLFLGSARSTLITGLAIPTSLLGSFVMMYVFGFTINMMTLLAMSLAVGLLIDDAIVVRENIFKRQEAGEPAEKAAVDGTREVALAVVATTAAVIAVFLPIAFLQGIVGQFFKQFGLTVVFAMAISLFDALTIAPMMSAYFAAGGSGHGAKKKAGALDRLLAAVDRGQTRLEEAYEWSLRRSIGRPWAVLAGAAALFVGSLGIAALVPKTFLPPQDNGQFSVSLELEPGASLEATAKAAAVVDGLLRAHPEVKTSKLTVGNADNESHKADFYVELVPRRKRTMNTTAFKNLMREELKPYASWRASVKDYDDFGAGMRPFNLVLLGQDAEALRAYSDKVYARFMNHPALLEPETSEKPGKPEGRTALDEERARRLGLSTLLVGRELRAQIEGETPAVYRKDGREYDVRVRLQEDQRDIQADFAKTLVPNVNGRLVRLSDAARAVSGRSPAAVNRSDRARSVRLGADVAPGGSGLGGAMAEFRSLAAGELKPPPGVAYRFEGQAEDFEELIVNMALAAGLAVFFIFLALASLYESFITPLTIMLVLPLAASGGFLALWLTGQSLDIYSMIGMILLLGIATKNSILLVDRTKQLTARGMPDMEAAIRAGRDRLRPILMTSFALVAGMIPVAVGLNEASAQRTSMGVTAIGGIVSSTFLTLFVVPAAYALFERFRVWSLARARRIGGLDAAAPSAKPAAAERALESLEI